MPKSRKPQSTVERWMKKPEFKRAVAEEAQELMLSELVLAIMAEDGKSVRELADELGLSKTVIQNLRTGGQNDMKLSNFVRFARAYGYQIVLEKDDQRLTL